MGQPLHLGAIYLRLSMTLQLHSTSPQGALIGVTVLTAKTLLPTIWPEAENILSQTATVMSPTCDTMPNTDQLMVLAAAGSRSFSVRFLFSSVLCLSAAGCNLPVIRHRSVPNDSIEYLLVSPDVVAVT